jgi:hypothetical protein
MVNARIGRHLDPAQAARSKRLPLRYLNREDSENDEAVTTGARSATCG